MENSVYSKEGIDNFLKFANYDSIKASLSKNMKMYVAKVNEKMLGEVIL